jgi:hypothetical protein
MRRITFAALMCCALLVVGCGRKVPGQATSQTPAAAEQSASQATSAAVDYVHSIVVDKDARSAYKLLDDTTRARITEPQLNERMRRIPGFGQVSTVTATGAEPVPGLQEVRVALQATTPTSTIYYLLVMSGTPEAGYRSKAFSVAYAPLSSLQGEIGPPQARGLADQVAEAVVANRPAVLFELMESAFRASTTAAESKASVERIILYGGKPLKAVFKQEASGVGAYAGKTGPVLTYWYRLDTSGGTAGPYFLKVDVVRDGSVYAVGQFSVVNFPVNGPPSNLQ